MSELDFKYILFISFCTISIFGCRTNSTKNTQTTPAFYHWQTHLSLSETEKNYLSELAITKIYPKFFDVDWDFNQKAPTALATLILSQALPEDLTIVPTIFITNRTFLQISPNDLPDLAQKIVQKLQGQMVEIGQHRVTEIQFDCDWNKTTQLKYFSLLKWIKKELPEEIELSATIRLHQIKYAKKTGVPPVKRGMLMYYNMGEVQNQTTQNSILDNAIGQKYIAQLSQYPLPLDVALPLFQWGVLFRNNRMIKLLNQLSESELADNQRFIKKDKNHWQVVKSTYLNGVYLYKGDEIRLEKSAFSDLKTAAELLSKQLKKEDRNIVFYHLDSIVIQQFKETEIAAIIDYF